MKIQYRAVIATFSFRRCYIIPHRNRRLIEEVTIFFRLTKTIWKYMDCSSCPKVRLSVHLLLLLLASRKNKTKLRYCCSFPSCCMLTSNRTCSRILYFDSWEKDSCRNIPLVLPKAISISQC